MKQDNSSGYVALRDGAALVDRGGSGRILMTGADRRSYLQGLLTNDVASLIPGTGCYAAMLTAQGRMMTDMRVVELGDGVLIDLPVEVAGAICDHFDRFVFTEDVKVEDVTTSRGELGLYGPRALEVLQAAGTDGSAPAALFGASRVRIAGVDAVLIAADEPGVRGFDIVAAASDIESIRAALIAGGAVPASVAEVETVRIEQGRPRFGADLDTDTIPLEAGLEERAISRSKGCYVGQEVIVRVQDRGHGRVARRLIGLTLAGWSPVPAAGARIEAAAPGDATGRDIGRITSAAFSPALGRPVALGYVQRDFATAGTVVAVQGAGEAIVAALPLVPLQ